MDLYSSESCAGILSPPPIVERWPTGWAGLTNVCVSSDECLSAVIQVRARALRQHGIAPREVSLRDSFDEALNSTVYLLLDGSVPAGSIRASVRDLARGWDATPARSAYAAEIDRHLDGRVYLDLTRLCAVRANSGMECARLLALLQNGTAEADAHRCEYILAPARIEHVGFYLAMGFRSIAEARPFSFAPAVELLVLDWTTARSHLRRHRRYRRMFTERNLCG
jgi:hypothetical protein